MVACFGKVGAAAASNTYQAPTKCSCGGEMSQAVMCAMPLMVEHFACLAPPEALDTAVPSSD